MRRLIFVFLMLPCVALSAPYFIGANRQQCRAIYAEYQHYFSERFWMDYEDRRMELRTEADRQAWVQRYAENTRRRDMALKAFNLMCGRGL